MNLAPLKFGLAATLALATALLSGCGGADPPPFRLNMMEVVENRISPEHQQAIADILGGLFGTPDQPYVMPETGLDQRLLQMAAGPVWSDQLTGPHGLYRRHCAHCHGVSGNGMGPTAMLLDPYPRDYRTGEFKFKSTITSAKPTDEDLRRVLHNGVPGTAMPSFALLDDYEIKALMEYVKYLSMRGEMESALINFVALELDPDDPLDPSEDADLRQMIMEDFLANIVSSWQDAPEQIIYPNPESIPPADRSPEEVAASVAKGRELFFSAAKGNCFLCHGPTGLGDGQQTDFDNWNKAVHEFLLATEALPRAIAADEKELDGLENEEDREIVRRRIEEREKELADRRAVAKRLLPVRNAIPRNLRLGMYRGGGRPIDFFWRISAGIAGTPMPAGATLSEEEVWQIVDYVHSLPFEPISRPVDRPVTTGEIVR